MNLDQKDCDALEALIDKTNLSSVLDALGDICRWKAAHLNETWQERYGSPHERWWRVWGGKMYSASRMAEAGERDLKIHRGAA